MTNNAANIGDAIRQALSDVQSMADAKTVIGDPIVVGDITLIPVSKVSIGFATGGLDYGAKKFTSSQNFGGGGGTGVSITPIAFLTVGKDAEVNLIPIASSTSGLDRALSVIERSPEIIEKIKDALT